MEMIKQSLQQKQVQKLSPLQIQTIKLLELPTLELEQKIQKELEEKRKAETEAVNLCSQWDMKVEKMRQAQGFKQANVDRIDGEIERAGKELQEILDALAQNHQQVEEKNRNIQEIRKTIEASYEAETNSEKSLKEDAKKKEELSA